MKPENIYFKRSQLYRAMDLLQTTKIYDACKTSDMILQTSCSHFVFVVTKPTSSGNKIEELLAATNDAIDQIILTGLEAAKKQGQFMTQFRSCYIEYRATGFRGGDPRQISLE